MGDFFKRDLSALTLEIGRAVAYVIVQIHNFRNASPRSPFLLLRPEHDKAGFIFDLGLQTTTTASILAWAETDCLPGS